LLASVTVFAPAAVVRAERAWIAALQAYYRARDGERGFLGKYERAP